MSPCVSVRGCARPGCSSEGQVLEVVLKLRLLGGRGDTGLQECTPQHTHSASSFWNTNSHFCWGCTQLAGTRYSFSWSFFSTTHTRVYSTHSPAALSVQRPRVIPRSGPCGVGRWLINHQKPPSHPQGQLHRLPLASLATPPLGLILNVRRSRSSEKRPSVCLSLSRTHVHTYTRTHEERLLCSKFIVFFCQLREAGAGAGWNTSKRSGVLLEGASWKEKTGERG